MALTNEQAIEHYTELMRRVSVGAYLELEHDGSYPPDDGTPESTTLESIDNLETWARKQGLAFHWVEETYKLEPMTPEEIATYKEAEELAEVCKVAGEQAAHDIPYVYVGDVRPYQYHYQSGRWYVEVDLTHHDPEQGKAVALYRVERVTIPHGNYALAAFKVDIREAE